MKFSLFCLLTIFCFTSTAGQHSLASLRIDSEINIDGVFDEQAWLDAEVATGFVNWVPMAGVVPSNKTEVRVMYDDKAVYVGAFMENKNREEIKTELSQRDDIGNTDWFGFILDTYGNGTEGSEFIVAATGVQFDAKVTPNGEDENWNEVWYSAVQITDTGWYAELKIPYSAIRFPNTDNQSWRINFLRRMAATGEKCSYQYLDPEVEGFINQSAFLTGVSEIKSPIRLSLSPYLTGYLQTNNSGADGASTNAGYSYNGGLDLKYGINEAFTLDMTLIPDFGQVQSDDQVLNLSPFEVRFDENRAFFTEGLDLFEKGGLFYTRRVGGFPIGYYNGVFGLANNEVAITNPQETQLYNATKLSGRTNGGLGVGIFNAISGSTTATIHNADTDEIREIETSPLTNYSVIVLDQNLRNNSSVSLINTNVSRRGESFYDANVTGIEFDIRNNSQTYRMFGGMNISQLIFEQQDNINGINYELGIGKISGNFRFELETEGISDSYNNNDLGYLTETNIRNQRLGLTYNWNKGWKSLDRGTLWFNSTLNTTYEDNRYGYIHLNSGIWTQTSSQWTINMWTNLRPESNDFFESRVSGLHLKRPGFYNMGWYIGTDGRKPFRLGMRIFGHKRFQEGSKMIEYEIEPRYRFSDQFSLFVGSTITHNHNDLGFATFDFSEPIIGLRDQTTVGSLVGLNYTLNATMALNVRTRHYWSKVTYDEFYTLDVDGGTQTSAYSSNHDIIYNVFNMDLNYTWRFAPGSDLIFNWKTNILKNDFEMDEFDINQSYVEGIQSLNSFPSQNSISIRMIYFLNAANYL